MGDRVDKNKQIASIAPEILAKHWGQRFTPTYDSDFLMLELMSLLYQCHIREEKQKLRANHWLLDSVNKIFTE